MIVAINLFKGDEAVDLERLLEIVRADIVPALKKQRGFVSTKFHRSTDGKEILQYTEWKSIEDHLACFNSTEMAAAGKRLQALLDAGKVTMNLQTYKLI